MCGISGIAGLGATLNNGDFSDVGKMSSALHHRGPDSRGLLPDPYCVLGNTRLNIIDPSPRADLPMRSEDGAVRLSYNGEVTNFRELRDAFRLDQKYRFLSHSDSEVVLRLYQELGIGFLRHLSGMFAFCLYDKKKAKAYLVRDFYGLRPVFYAQKNNRLYFASELNALREIDGFRERQDKEALYHYFSLAYIPGEKTPYENVQELPGGHFLEIDLRAGKVEKKRYYRLKYSPDHSRGEERTVAQLRSLLEDSVRRNLVSDAPVGLALSGGVDSSSILALAADMGKHRDLHAFSIKMSEPSFDESRYQKIVTDAIPCRHHTVEVGPQDVLDNLVSHMAAMGEPSGDGASVPLYLLSREAKKHVSVLLSGEGGDEVFNAYETHRAYRARGLYRKFAPRPVRAALRAAAGRLPVSHKKLSHDFILKRFLDGSEQSVAEAHFYWRHAFTDGEKSELMPGLPGYRPTSSHFTDLFDGLDFDDDLDKLSLIDIEYYLIDDLMVKNDRMGMAHSVESRFPYMDRRLIDFVSTIPADMRLNGLEGRYIQKQALRDLLPGAVFRRKNMGLEMPHSAWFLGAFRETAERYFSPKNVAQTELLDPSAVSRLWRRHLNKEKDLGRPLWCVLNYLIWFDLFIKNGDYKKHLPSALGS